MILLKALVLEEFFPSATKCSQNSVGAVKVLLPVFENESIIKIHFTTLIYISRLF